MQLPHHLLVERALGFSSAVVLILKLFYLQLICLLAFIDCFVQLLEPECELFIDPHHFVLSRFNIVVLCVKINLNLFDLRVQVVHLLR